jgi:hypothetical protein
VSAGIQPNLGLLNQQAGNLAVNLRNDFQNIINFNQWLNSYGASNLEALGMSTADTSTLISTFGNLANLAQIYIGAASAPTTFNFQANSEALWGGQ